MENENPKKQTLRQRIDELEQLTTHLHEVATINSAKLAVQGFAISALLRSQPENQKFSSMLKKVTGLLLSGDEPSPGHDYEHYVTEQLNAFLESAKGLRPES